MKKHRGIIVAGGSSTIIDEIITENSGTYTIEGNAVIKDSFKDKNTISLPMLSSLLFGGVSLREAVLAGIVTGNLSSEAEKFFSLNRNIFLSEFF